MTIATHYAWRFDADAEVLERQVVEACQAGASGFIAGRTVWEHALVPDASQRRGAPGWGASRHQP
ncbi:MAG TPA: hypothetical protein VFY84_10465 [Jiangellales bacterium]|nr:hypothetical protein [Jiangellales bacterium]